MAKEMWYLFPVALDVPKCFGKQSPDCEIYNLDGRQ